MDRADRCVRRTAFCGDTAEHVLHACCPRDLAFRDLGARVLYGASRSDVVAPSGGINSPPAISGPTARELELRVPGNKREPQTVGSLRRASCNPAGATS